MQKVPFSSQGPVLHVFSNIIYQPGLIRRWSVLPAELLAVPVAPWGAQESGEQTSSSLYSLTAALGVFSLLFGNDHSASGQFLPSSSWSPLRNFGLSLCLLLQQVMLPSTVRVVPVGSEGVYPAVLPLSPS